jgi:hypothetical protein
MIEIEEVLDMTRLSIPIILKIDHIEVKCMDGLTHLIRFGIWN